jgi:hypothetical protein
MERSSLQILGRERTLEIRNGMKQPRKLKRERRNYLPKERGQTKNNSDLTPHRELERRCAPGNTGGLSTTPRRFIAALFRVPNPATSERHGTGRNGPLATRLSPAPNTNPSHVGSQQQPPPSPGSCFASRRLAHTKNQRLHIG